jgi:tRNA(fMet)-specific endonuclease VapC
MRYIIIDTCVIIHIIRESTTGKNCINELKAFDTNPTIIISVVTKGELQSFSVQNKWGEKKIALLTTFLNHVTCINIENNDEKLLNAYSKIDSYSKRKHVDKNGNLLNASAKTMGKNDLWIAATALALDIPVLTADSDFDHLNNTILKIIKIS